MSARDQDADELPLPPPRAIPLPRPSIRRVDTPVPPSEIEAITTRAIAAQLAEHREITNARFDLHEQRTQQAIGRVERRQQEQSQELASIGAAVIRIETRLGAAEQTATTAARDAARASQTNELVNDMARVVIEDKRDEIQAARDRRRAIWSAFGKASAFVFSAAGIAAIASALSRCGG